MGAAQLGARGDARVSRHPETTVRSDRHPARFAAAPAFDQAFDRAAPPETRLGRPRPPGRNHRPDAGLVRRESFSFAPRVSNRAKLAERPGRELGIHRRALRTRTFLADRKAPCGRGPDVRRPGALVEPLPAATFRGPCGATRAFVS